MKRAQKIFAYPLNKSISWGMSGYKVEESCIQNKRIWKTWIWLL